MKNVTLNSKNKKITVKNVMEELNKRGHYPFFKPYFIKNYKKTQTRKRSHKYQHDFNSLKNKKNRMEKVLEFANHLNYILNI